MIGFLKTVSQPVFGYSFYSNFILCWNSLNITARISFSLQLLISFELEELTISSPSHILAAIPTLPFVGMFLSKQQCTQRWFFKEIWSKLLLLWQEWPCCGRFWVQTGNRRTPLVEVQSSRNSLALWSCKRLQCLPSGWIPILCPSPFSTSLWFSFLPSWENKHVLPTGLPFPDAEPWFTTVMSNEPSVAHFSASTSVVELGSRRPPLMRLLCLQCSYQTHGNRAALVANEGSCCKKSSPQSTGKITYERIC